MEEPGTFPSEHRLDYPLTDAAQRYFQHGLPFLHRYLPFWAASLVSRFMVMLLPLLTLAIPLVRLLPPVYAWRQNSKVRKLYEALAHLEEGELSEAKLAEIEAKAREVSLPPGYLHRIHDFLLHLERARARVAGAGLASSSGDSPESPELSAAAPEVDPQTDA